MKSQDNYDPDDDYLEDPIQLNFGENAPRLENLQFLDPGIIDLDCDSDEDCKYIDEDTIDISLPGGAICLKSEATTNDVIVKPVCIKLIDCFKFPWYFDKPTKDIIENKLVINSVNVSISGQIMDDCSRKFRSIADKFLNDTVDNKHVSNSVNNNISEQIIDINYNKLRKENDKICVNKEIDVMNRVHEMFSTRTIDPIKRIASTKKRNDMELLKAISQRNKTGVDIKKNKGLVGMKIKRIVTERQPLEIGRNKQKNSTEIQKERKEQETLNKLYVQSVDKALINIGTTISPVFETLQNTKETSNSVSQDAQTDSSVKSPDRLTCNLNIHATLEDDNNGNEFKDTSGRKDISGKDMSIKINENTKAAEEIVRIFTSQSGEICHVKDTLKHSDKKNLCKAMPLSKKRENERKAINVEENKSILKHQGITDGYKMTKMIMPIPLSKARKKVKQESFKQPKIKVGEAKESKSITLSSSSLPKKIAKDKYTAKTESKNYRHQNGSIQSPKVTSAKPATQSSNANTLNKSFHTLNSFTENILNKIQAKHKLSKINKQDRLYKKHAKNIINYVDQPKSIEKCNSKLSPSIAKAIITKEDGNVLKDASLFTLSLDETLEDISAAETGATGCKSPKISFIQLQYSNKNIPENSPKTNKSHPDNHVQFPHNIATNKLNTNIMKTVKTDYAKIEEANSRIFVENTHSNSTISNNPAVKSNTDQHSIANSTGMKGSGTRSLKDVPLENIDDCIKNKGNSKPMHVTQKSPMNNAAQIEGTYYTIQTIINSRNEYAGEHNSTYTANNINVRTHVPETQVSAIIIKPTQTPSHQAQVKNKSLSVHNSMQSHILYRPPKENQSPQMYPNNPEGLRYQVSIQQMNQATYQQPNPIWYPPLYNETIAPNTATNIMTASEVTAGIPKMTMSRTMPSGINCSISTQMGVNANPPRVIGDVAHVGMNARPMMPDTNEPILTKMRVSQLPDTNRGNPPYIAMNNRQIPSGVNTSTRPQTGNNVRPPGVHAGIASQMAMNARPMPPAVIEPNSSQTAMNARLQGVNVGSSPHQPKNRRPSKACDIQPGKVFWSYAFPPPKSLPPPPPLPPSSQEITGFLFTAQAIDSSIIGRNNDGVVKKINITTPVANHNTVHSKQDSTLPNDESQLANTKSEMLRVLDNTVEQMQSPIKHFQNAFSISAKQSPANNLKELLPIREKDLKSSPLLQGTEKLVCTSKHKLPIDIQPTKPNHDLKNTMPINHGDNNRPVFNSKKTNNADLVNLKRALPINEVKNVSTAKYKPGPLSKKLKLNDSRASPNQPKTKELMIPSKGYSPPILPIPTYEKIMSDIAVPCNKIFDWPVEASMKTFDKTDAKTNKKVSTNPNKLTRKRKQFEQDTNKIDTSKKISLDEYKKRSASDRRADEEYEAFMNTQKETFKKNTVDMHRRASTVDSDLGYDSDVTVKL